jgi:hypothetical protein
MIIPWWLVILVYGLLGLAALGLILKLAVKRASRCKGCGQMDLIWIRQMGADDLEQTMQIVEDLGLPVSLDSPICVCRACKTVHDPFFQPERLPRCRACRQLTGFVADGHYQCLSCAKRYVLQAAGRSGYRCFRDDDGKPVRAPA